VEAFNKRESQMQKTNRNDLCPCGSGKKYKRCCLPQQSVEQPLSFMDDEGIHFVGTGAKPTEEELELMTKEYQNQIRSSPLWHQMVKEFGKEKAEKLLRELKAETKK
jgi:hypothetical protein